MSKRLNKYPTLNDIYSLRQQLFTIKNMQLRFTTVILSPFPASNVIVQEKQMGIIADIIY